MKDDNARRLRANRVWLTPDSCDLNALRGNRERSVNRADVSLRQRRCVECARSTTASEARKAAASPESGKECCWSNGSTSIADGPGIIVIREQNA